MIFVLVLISCAQQNRNKENSVQSTKVSELNFLDKKYFNEYTILLSASDLADHPCYYDYMGNLGYFSVNYIGKTPKERNYWTTDFLKETQMFEDENSANTEIKNKIEGRENFYNIFILYIPPKFIDTTYGSTFESIELKDNAEASLYYYDQEAKNYKFIKIIHNYKEYPTVSNPFFLVHCPEYFIYKKETETDCQDRVIKTIGEYSFTELGLACYNGDLDTSEKLIKKGACKTSCMTDGTFEYDVLYTSVMFGKINLIKYFIGLEKDVNRFYGGFYGEKNMTLLSLACRNEHQDAALYISNLLLNAGAEVNGGCEFTCTVYPLFEAVTHNNIKLVKLLIERGADITVRDAQGETIFTIVDGMENNINADMKDYINSLRSRK